MKVAEIKETNREILMKRKSFEFFRALYVHCIETVEKVPDEFINDVFIKIYDTDSILSSIHIGGKAKENKTYVMFECENEIEDDDIICDHWIEDDFDYKYISVKIPLDNAEEDVVYFYIADSDFTTTDLRKIFGKNLLGFTEDEFYAIVAIKCLE